MKVNNENDDDNYKRLTNDGQQDLRIANQLLTELNLAMFICSFV